MNLCKTLETQHFLSHFLPRKNRKAKVQPLEGETLKAHNRLCDIESNTGLFGEKHGNI